VDRQGEIMDKRHIIKLQGREFVTYEGLLDEAHHKGLKSIRTSLVQVPTEANDNTAICTAEVELELNGDRRTFTGNREANPKKVKPNIAAHVIRMAETRAKARALRDAINVGMTAVEELEGAGLPAEIGDENSGSSGGAAKPARNRTLSLVESPKVATAVAPADLATKAQIDRVTKEMKRTGLTPEQGRSYLLQHFNKSSRLELSQNEIEQFLSHLKGMPDLEASGS
jgi:hypothetical protein